MIWFSFPDNTHAGCWRVFLFVFFFFFPQCFPSFSICFLFFFPRFLFHTFCPSVCTSQAHAPNKYSKTQPSRTLKEKKR